MVDGSPRENAEQRAWVEVDAAALAHNVRQFVDWVRPAAVMAVVKADGYGHGALVAARAALGSGARYLGVATTPEGLALRRAGIRAPILVLGVEGAAQPLDDLVQADLTATVTTLEAAQRIAGVARSQGRRVRVHLKVDTGMGRLGVLPEQAAGLARAVAGLPWVELEGVYSHLATADEPDLSYTEWQARRFDETLASLEAAGVRPRLRHLANTAGALVSKRLHFDLVRLGLGMYGCYPAPHLAGRLGLRPALRLVARLSEVRELPEGSGISYGRAYVTPRPTTIGTLPVGYADGFTRRLSGHARALIQGEVFPVVGRICMDQCMVDLRGRRFGPGTPAVLLGPGDQGEMSLDEAARLTGTISYELMTQLGPRLPRVVAACQDY